MKKLFFTLLAIATVGGATAQTTKNLSVSDFSAINASGIYDITLIKSDACSVTVTCSDPLADRIQVSVSDGTLNLQLKEEFKNTPNNGYIKATVKIKTLEGLNMSGATKLNSDASFTVNHFTGRFSGASNASGLNLSGNNLDITVSGASNLELIEKFTSAEIEASGASNVKVSATNNHSEFSVSGATTLVLSGRSDKLSAEASGASSIKGGDFTAINATVSTSGASYITLDVTKTLNAEASGASSIHYGGNPTTVNKENSKASSISKR